MPRAPKFLSAGRAEELHAARFGAPPTVAEPGDVMLTRGSSWLSKAIRFLTREPGEAPTLVNHAGIIVAGRPRWGDCRSVEALGNGVRLRELKDGYDLSQGGVQVWRHRNGELAAQAAGQALKRVGQTYGYLKLLLHAGDWLLTRNRFRVFRRVARVDRWPICSYLVADAFDDSRKALGVADVWPGFNPKEMTPDDIYDIVTHSPDWTLVRPHGSRVR